MFEQLRNIWLRNDVKYHVKFIIFSWKNLYAKYVQCIPVIVPEVGPPKDWHYKQLTIYPINFTNKLTNGTKNRDIKLTLYPIWHYI